MHIAVASRINRITTLDAKGGSEVWTAQFCLEHAKRGHSIDLYATQGSLSGGGITLVPLIDRQLADYYDEAYLSENPPDDPARQMRYEERFTATIYTRALVEILRRKNEYDVIVDSVGSPVLSFNLHTVEKPVIAIGHHTVSPAIQFYVDRFGWPANKVAVFPSRYQVERATFIPEGQRCVIPHGIFVHDFAMRESGGEKIVWMGRIDSRTDKGASEAMRAADMLGRNILATGAFEKRHQNKSIFLREQLNRIFPRVCNL